MSLETDVKKVIREHQPERSASILMMERVPYLFSDDWDEFRQWRGSLARDLGLDPCDIFLTGSSAVGISLNPYKDFRDFRPNSDIDLAIISPFHFDLSWRVIRATRKRDVDLQTWSIIQEHKAKYIFYGCIACNKILPHFPFAATWLAAFDRAAKAPATFGREISARIYRDTESLRSYHVANLRKIKSDLS